MALQALPRRNSACPIGRLMFSEAGQGQLKLVEEKLELWVMPILLLSSFWQRRLLQEGLIKFQIEQMHTSS